MSDLNPLLDILERLESKPEAPVTPDKGVAVAILQALYFLDAAKRQGVHVPNFINTNDVESAKIYAMQAIEYRAKEQA